MSDNSIERLNEIRGEIDHIDDQWVALLAQRHELVIEASAIKSELGIPIVQSERYESMLERLAAQANQIGVDPELIKTVFSAIHNSSVIYQIKHRSEP